VRGDAVGVSSAGPAAVAGLASIVVPVGVVEGLPLAVALIGRPNAEPLLAEIAQRIEHARGVLPPPRFVPTLEVVTP
jgi:Asp-tRNA(Asn)/Glu-tRNA(Gln) amidotransferase A subunit family amidase